MMVAQMIAAQGSVKSNLKILANAKPVKIPRIIPKTLPNCPITMVSIKNWVEIVERWEKSLYRKDWYHHLKKGLKV